MRGSERANGVKKAKMVTQRECGALCFLCCEIDKAVLQGERDCSADDMIELSCTSIESHLKLPLIANKSISNERFLTKVWDWEGEVMDEGDEAAEWITQALLGMNVNVNTNCSVSSAGNDSRLNDAQRSRMPMPKPFQKGP